MSSSNKKAKTDDDTVKSDIETLRRYIVQCPDVSRDGRAVRAALGGLDAELKRMERDEKLRKKFASSTSVTAEAEAGEQEGTSASTNAAEMVSEEKKGSSASAGVAATAAAPEGSDDGLMEWTDVTSPTTESPLGSQLSELAISGMASAQTRVSSPLAAIALALHSALVSNVLEFKCTGIPDNGSGGGFAAPIRELPKSKFLPDKWDQCANDGSAGQNVNIRYRKDGVGPCVLRVHVEFTDLGNGGSGIMGVGSELRVVVKFAPTGGGKEEGEGLTFPLDTHVNLNSFSAALASERKGSRRTPGILPALHYKGLGVLLTNFATMFDLGAVNDSAEATSNSVPATTTVSGSTEAVSTGYTPVSAPYRGAGPPPVKLPTTVMDPTLPGRSSSGRRIGGTPGEIPTIQDFGHGSNPGGDFAGDLAPGGIANPNLGGVVPNPHTGGNLMGPNHPSFLGTGDDDWDGSTGGGGGVGGMPRPGGLGMQPRFDPYGPPGGPTDPGRFVDPNNPGAGRGRGRGRGGRIPGGTGDPNPDHQKPPSDLGGNMFM